VNPAKNSKTASPAAIFGSWSMKKCFTHRVLFKFKKMKNRISSNTAKCAITAILSRIMANANYAILIPATNAITAKKNTAIYITPLKIILYIYSSKRTFLKNV
jgi:hypothetical protein